MTELPTLRISFCLALAPLLGSGCASTPPQRSAPVYWPRESAKHHFRAAHQKWIEFMTGRAGADDEQSLDDVLALLERAQHEDGRVALYPGQVGAIQLRLAALAARREDHGATFTHLERAQSAFERAIALSEHWVPGHRGLAVIAIQRGRFDDADSHLAQATQSLAEATGLAPEETSLLERLLGDPLGAQKPPDVLAVVPTEEQQHALRLGQLAETEEWTLDFQGAEQPLYSGENTAVGPLLVRLRDRIWLTKAVLEKERALAAGTRRERALQNFVAELEAKVLAGPGNLTDAYVARARAYRELGQHERARDTVQYLLSSDRPLLRANPTLRSLDTDLAIEGLRADVANWKSAGDSAATRPLIERIADLTRREDVPLGKRIDVLRLYVEVMLQISRRQGNSTEPLERALREIRQFERNADTEDRTQLRKLRSELEKALKQSRTLDG